MADTKQDVLDMLRELAELTMLDEASHRHRAADGAPRAKVSCFPNIRLTETGEPARTTSKCDEAA